MQLNASRITVLQAQDDLVSSMREAAGKELLRISGDQAAYKKLLKELVIQVGIFPFFYISIYLFLFALP
jgi:V-type H+-transporting ATPase subunit E